MSKLKIEELARNCKKLNKKELTEEIDIKNNDVDELAEDFVQAFERIDDDGKTSKIPKKLVEYYEIVLDYVESDKDEFDADEFDADELEEKLEDMDYKETKDFIKENGIEIDTKVKKKTFDDDQDDIVEEIVEAMKKKFESSGSVKKNKNEKGGNENKKDKLALPKGWRKNADPAKFLFRIREGDCKVSDLALILAKGKKKEAPKKANATMYMLARRMAPKIGVVITFPEGSENVADGIVTLKDE